MTIQKPSLAEKLFYVGAFTALASVLALGVGQGMKEAGEGAKADAAALEGLRAKGYTLFQRYAAGSSGAKYAFGYIAKKPGAEKFDDVRVECVKKAEAFTCK